MSTTPKVVSDGANLSIELMVLADKMREGKVIPMNIIHENTGSAGIISDRKFMKLSFEYTEDI